MTVAALTWAFRQVVPPKPKVILLSLADQAEELTGKVCYGPTNLDHIAKKSSVPRRTLSRQLGALVRHGYLRVESNKDRGLPSHYWLCLDREPAKKIEEWADAEEEWRLRHAGHADGDEGGDESEDESDAPNTQDVEGVGQNGLPYIAPETEIVTEQNGLPGGPLDGPGVGHIGGPQESTTTKEPLSRVHKPKKENGFSKEAQDQDRACVVAGRVNKAGNAKYFVVEGSDAWKYWSAEMTRRNGRIWSLSCEGSLNGRACRGWYFPSLYPPKTNKPATPPGELSDADARELAGT